MLTTFFIRKFNSILLILFMLTSCGGGGGGSGSNETEDPTDNSPSSPKSPTLTVKSAKEIDLSWNSVTGANYYQIYRNVSDLTSTSKKINEPTATTYSDTNLSSNTTYYYWLKACKTGGVCSEFSISASAKTKLIQPLNDSGITWGGDYSSGNNSNCTSNISASQDCNQGRDARVLANTLTKIGAGLAGFDFSKLGADGSVLSIQNGTWADNGVESNGTKWSCVKDNHTGLIWEVKTNDNGIHDKDNRYRWGGITAIGRDHASTEKGTYYDDWNSLVNGANQSSYAGATGLCGFTDWRVPAIYDLVTITNKNSFNPAIDDDYFSNSFPNSSSTVWYWSSSPFANNSNSAWQVNFLSGWSGRGFRGGNYLVRLVRGRQ